MPFLRWLLGLTLLCSPLWMPAQTDLALHEVAPIPVAHAHNDYLHKRPLVDALAQGFTSVEIDVYLRRGDQLRVAHLPTGAWFCRRQIERLYLAPLLYILAHNKGRIYPERPLLVYVDIKNKSEPAYQALRDKLKPLRPYLTHYENGHVTPGPVSVVLTGYAPDDLVLAQSERWCALDGGLGDLDNPKRSVYTTPVVSAKWQSHFNWNGKGEMPKSEREKLRRYARKAADKDMTLRFYHTPERPALWRALVAAGVGLVSTDDLEGFRAWWFEKGQYVMGGG